MSEPEEQEESVIYFRSNKNPKERGSIALTADGMIEVRPSEEFLDELAQREEAAVDVSRKLGIRTGLVLIGLGCLCAAAGWLAGRIGGKLRLRVTEPRLPQDVTLFADITGGFHITLPGPLGQTIELNWGMGEVSPREVGAFIKAYRKYVPGNADRAKPQYR
jgi:hypothetical protein